MYLGRTLPPDEFMAHWRGLKEHVRFPGDFSGSARFREELRRRRRWTTTSTTTKPLRKKRLRTIGRWMNG